MPIFWRETFLSCDGRHFEAENGRKWTRTRILAKYQHRIQLIVYHPLSCFLIPRICTAWDKTGYQTVIHGLKKASRQLFYFSVEKQQKNQGKG